MSLIYDYAIPFLEEEVSIYYFDEVPFVYGLDLDGDNVDLLIIF
jgi:hypothetical protein